MVNGSQSRPCPKLLAWPSMPYFVLPAPQALYRRQLQRRCCPALQAARSLGSSQPDALHLRALAGARGCAPLRWPRLGRHESPISSKSALQLPRYLGSHPVHGNLGAHLPVPLVLRAENSPVSIFDALRMQDKAHTLTRSMFVLLSDGAPECGLDNRARLCAPSAGTSWLAPPLAPQGGAFRAYSSEAVPTKPGHARCTGRATRCTTYTF